MVSRCLAALIFLLTSLVSGAALAQDANTRVFVPEAPNGAVVSGCYQADRSLYGANLSFCLERRGTYQARANNVRCEGRLNWSVSGRDVRIDLRRQSCTGNVAWAAASITCRPQGLLDKILTDIFGGANKERVLVPQINSLRCTYHPSVPGKREQTFVAKRR